MTPGSELGAGTTFRAAQPAAATFTLGGLSWLFSAAVHGGFLLIATYAIFLPGGPSVDRKPLPPLIIHPETEATIAMEFRPPPAAPAARETDPAEVPELLPPADAVPRLEAPDPPQLVVSAEPLAEDRVPVDALTVRIAPPAARESSATETAVAPPVETFSAAHLAQPIRIDYPAHARRRGLEGVVEVEIAVDETGAVTTLRVAVSSGHPVLDAAALRGLAGVRFSPALRNGRPVPHTFRQPVRFVLREAR